MGRQKMMPAAPVYELHDQVNVIGHGKAVVVGRSFSDPSRYDVRLESNKLMHNLVPSQLGEWSKNDDL